MSQNRPPSPVQPPVVTSTAYDQVQRQSIAGASYLGRSGPRQLQSFPPPRPGSLHPQQPIDRQQHTQASLHLPPIRPPSVRYDTDNLDQPLAFADPLSWAPSPHQSVDRLSRPLTQDVQHLASSSATQSQNRTRSWEDERSDANNRGGRLSHPLHPSYDPIVSQFTFQNDTDTQPLQTRNVPNHPERDQYVHSPAITVGSFVPSHYSGSSEQSPGVQSAAFHFPGAEPIVSEPPPLDYHLSIRQQPIAARACGFGERDRRVIDPPPILELKITNKETGAPEQDSNAMLALHCTLLSAGGDENDTPIDTTLTDVPSARRLMGTLVASPYQAKDEYGRAGTFFVFSDLSCRSPGTYKLDFKMLRVDPMYMQPGAKHGCVASIETDAFTVYTAKDFPGMRASSALLMALRGQGLTVGLKKGTEARLSKGRKRHESESGEEDEGDDSENEEHADTKPRRATSSEMTSPKRKVKKKSKKSKK